MGTKRARALHANNPRSPHISTTTELENLACTLSLFLLMPSHALIQWHWRTSCLTRPGTKAWRMTLENLSEKFLVHTALLVRLNSRLVPPACQTQLCLFGVGAGRGQAGRTACVRLVGAKQGELLVSDWCRAWVCLFIPGGGRPLDSGRGSVWDQPVDDCFVRCWRPAALGECETEHLANCLFSVGGRRPLDTVKLPKLLAPILGLCFLPAGPGPLLGRWPALWRSLLVSKRAKVDQVQRITPPSLYASHGGWRRFSGWRA